MRQAIKNLSWLSGDRRLLIVFAIVDIVLIVFAHQHFKSLKQLTADPVFLKPGDTDKVLITKMEELTTKGDWEGFQTFLDESTLHYLESTTRPNPRLALYFFPETLPENSFEREFAAHELKSGLEALKNAFINKDQTTALEAWMRLQSRIMNYELGSTIPTSELSSEAKTFLQIYKKMAEF